MTATGGLKELVEILARMKRSGSVRATKVEWGWASGTWSEGSGWTCDACHVKFGGDEPTSRQKRKLKAHVKDKKHPCTQQARARATRASLATMGAPQALNPSPSQPVSNQIAMLESHDGWTLTKPPAVQLRETWSKRLGAHQSWVFVCRKAFDPASEWRRNGSRIRSTNQRCTQMAHGKS